MTSIMGIVAMFVGIFDVGLRQNNVVDAYRCKLQLSRGRPTGTAIWFSLYVRPSVCPSACPIYSIGPQQQSRCCRFAAVGPAGRRYLSMQQRRPNAGSATLSAYVGSPIVWHRLVSSAFYTAPQRVSVYFCLRNIHRCASCRIKSRSWENAFDTDFISLCFALYITLLSWHY